jgi:hypothetical protein
MHLFWSVDVPRGARVVEVRATLELFERPRARELWFWALQASFGRAGGAHLGLQWHPDYPGSTAANFGGYARGGGELAGGVLAHPSALGNPNTCDFAWAPSRPYRLAIAQAAAGQWSGSIDGEVLRVLSCDDGGVGLIEPMVWTECFARCDAPPATARWSDFEVRTDRGDVIAVHAARVNYQSLGEGGCDTGRIDELGGGVWLQTTGVSRSPAR